MSARRYSLCPWILIALIANGCSPAADAASSNSSDAASETSADSGFTFETDPVDSAASVEDTVPVDTAPACTPTGGVDDPDDEFKDTNCDGIDGDKSKAVFVSPTGSDDGDGSIAAPFKTLARSIERATAASKDVYVCNGSYAENVTIISAVRVFGGYECKDGWKRTLERAVIAPSKGTPVIAKGVAGTGVRLDRLELRAPDGVDPGESSVGMFASESLVKITNTAIKVGAGADGASPSAAEALTSTATKGADANSFGTTSCTSVCAGGTPSLACKAPAPGAQTTTAPACEGHGGRGGDGGVSKWSGREYLATAGAAGGPSPVGAPARGTAGIGLDGSPGLAGGNGTSSTTGFGEVTADGYVAKNAGTSGERGGSGGGGSGGWGHAAGNSSGDICASWYWNGGGGGEGGYGGCGGAGGAGGGGGGASIALLSWKSTVSLSKTTLDTAGGGRGGNGAAGADGQAGGVGGSGAEGTQPGYAGYAGGAGGRGGRGGSGGAGGGGASFGIVHVGSAPSLEAVSFNVVGGGSGGSSSSGPGKNGEYGDTYDATPK